MIRLFQECASVWSGETIKITHWRETEFLDGSRGDLADASEAVVIFSPFLSPNRASCYYAVLDSLGARRVTVDIYARPRHEQPSFNPNTTANKKAIYFAPNCEPHFPSGITGGVNFGILARIPVLVN